LAQEKIEVPITGKIISVDAKVGDQVKDGDVLCLLESMNSQIGVTADQAVKPGDTIAVIEY